MSTNDVSQEPTAPAEQTSAAPESGSNVVGEGQAPAESSPGAIGGTVDEAAAQSEPAPPVESAPDAVQAEAAAVETATAEPTATNVEAAVEPVVTSALAALEQSKAVNPHLSFAEHLKVIADKGLAAVLNPADESAVLGAVVQVLKEVIA